MTEVLSFDQVLEGTKNIQTNVLLGNGFSRAWKDGIFNYSTLRSKAGFEGGWSNTVKKVFDRLETDDFESVIRALKQSSELVKVYDGDNEVAKKMEVDSEWVKNLLGETIANSHPDCPTEVKNEEYMCCKKFLKNFAKIFTLNYDLLLYWAILPKDRSITLNFCDGFTNPEDGGKGYVEWKSQERQNVFYLHGALHIYEEQGAVRKRTQWDTGIKLKQQIVSALKEDKFPLIVADGLAYGKMEKIQRTSYLHHGHEALRNVEGVLITFGWKMGECDAHILSALEKGKVSQIYVGLYGNPETMDNKTTRKRAKEIEACRGKDQPVTVQFYSTDNVSVWR
jgi:hypothetical protein